MEAIELSEREAFGRIQQTARDRNLRLAEVAQRPIDQENLIRRER